MLDRKNTLLFNSEHETNNSIVKRKLQKWWTEKEAESTFYMLDRNNTIPIVSTKEVILFEKNCGNMVVREGSKHRGIRSCWCYKITRHNHME